LLLAADACHVWHPYTRHGVDDEPLLVQSASGARITLADGTELVDGIASWWASVHGHGHPHIIAAMHAQAKRLDHVLFAGATHEPAIKLAQRLVALAPAGLSRVFYSDDGSTAVEVALKMAYHAWVLRGQPQRRVFVALEGAYHGDTFGAMAVGDPDPYFTPFKPLFFEVQRVPPEASALAAKLKELGDRVAAVIVEPLLQAAAGMVMYPEAFLTSCRKSCDESGIFLIADEVATGFGRTGSMFACGRAGVNPDFLCLAKALTAGMALLSATLTTEAVFAQWSANKQIPFFPHGHTMTANPIACAVGLASLELMVRDDVPAKLDQLGKAIFEGVQSVRNEPHVKDVRRMGGVVAIELFPEQEGTSGYATPRSLRLRQVAQREGVLLRPLGDVLYAWPPACASEEDVAAIVRGLRAQVTAARPIAP
jgi:adenosylmethionine---8-amino-7-oxononanoate aminotransferase